MNHDLAKFLKGAEFRTLGRPLSVTLARVLVNVAAVSGALAAASAVAPARAAPPFARVDIVDHAPATRLTVTSRAASVHRAPVVRVAATDLEAAAVQALMSDGDGDVLRPSSPTSRRPSVLAADAIAGDAARAERPDVYPPAPRLGGRAVAPVVGPDGPKGFRGEPIPTSTMGVEYTAAPILHEHVDPRGATQIIEGGFTHRDTKGTNGNGLNSRGDRIDPTIPDPSDAFMNVAVQVYMQNTTSTWPAAVETVERMHAVARSCVEDMGQRHDCSFGTAGIAFDYGQRRFSARLTPALSDGKVLNKDGNTIVAYETPDGMYEGPAFDRGATAEPETVPTPRP